MVTAATKRNSRYSILNISVTLRYSKFGRFQEAVQIATTLIVSSDPYLIMTKLPN
jgi:hypothetical protein